MSAGGRSRAAALALLIGVIVVLGALVIVPTAFHWSRTGAIIEESRLKTQRADRRSDEAQTLADTKNAWNNFASQQRAGFVLAQTDDEGIAVTSNRVRNLLAQFNGSLNSLSGEATDAPREGVRKLTIETTGVLPRENLAPFLTALESEPAFLIISDFKARTRSTDQLSISFTADVFRLLESDA